MELVWKTNLEKRVFTIIEYVKLQNGHKWIYKYETLDVDEILFFGSYGYFFYFLIEM